MTAGLVQTTIGNRIPEWSGNKSSRVALGLLSMALGASVLAARRLHGAAMPRAETLTAMAADRGMGDRKPFAQLEGLREVAGGHADLVSIGAQALYERAHDEHVRAVREVDPDAHRRKTLTLREHALSGGRHASAPAQVSLPRDARPRVHLGVAGQRRVALRARRRPARDLRADAR